MNLSAVLKSIALFIVYYAATWVSLRVGMITGNIGAIWIPTAILNAVILRSVTARKPYYLSACMAGGILGDYSTGEPLWVCFGLQMGDFTGVALSALLIARTACIPFYIKGTKSTIYFILFIVLAGPMAGGLIGASVISLVHDQRYWFSWMEWVVSTALGNLIIGSLLLSWQRETLQQFRSLQAALNAALLVGLSIIVSTNIFHDNHVPLLFLVAPLLFWAAYRFEVPGTAVVALLISIITVWYTLVQGEGVIFRTYSTVYERLHFVELYLCIMVVPTLFLAGILYDNKKAQSELKSSEERYRRIVEYGGEGIFLFEFDEPIPLDLHVTEQHRLVLERGILSACNDQYASMFGYRSRSEREGVRIQDIVGESGELWRQPLFNAFHASNYRLTNQLVREYDRYGNTVYFSVNLVGILEQNRLTWIWGSQQDVSSHVEAEKSIQVYSKQIESIAQNLPGIIYRCEYVPGGDLHFTYSIGKLLDQFLEPDNDVEVGVNAVFERAEQAETETFFEALRQSCLVETPLTHEFRVKTKQDVVVWLKNQSQAMRGEDGRYQINGLLLNVTARKEAEAALILRNRAIEASSSGIIMTDPNKPDNPIIYVNKAFEKITGYSRDEIMGQNCRILQMEDREQPEVLAIREAIERKKPITTIIRNYKKDGTLFWNAVHISPVFDVNGKLTHFVGIQNDITEKKRTEEALRRTQKMEIVGQLTGGIAHDFNNLLSIILGNVELIKMFSTQTEEEEKRINLILHTANRGAKLTRRLLQFSQQDAASGEVTNVNHLISSLEDMIKITLPGKIDYQFHPGNNLWLTEIDPSEFEDVMLNLAINARDAMPKGGRLVIETGNRNFDESFASKHFEIPAGDFVSISVSDTGSGMSQEVMEHVLEPFFTTKPSGKGTGLGLSMVYGFVKRYRGDLKIYSEMGHGTTIRLLFPRVLSISDEEEKTAASSIIPKGNETVLLVDDEADLIDISKLILEDLGYRVIPANGVEEALSILERPETIHLLFTDVVMPGQYSGVDLARKAVEMRPGIKVLLTSGFTGKTVMEEVDERWIENLLHKPYDRIELADKVRTALDYESSD